VREQRLHHSEFVIAQALEVSAVSDAMSQTWLPFDGEASPVKFDPSSFLQPIEIK
jgi:hypothetical protein